MEYQHHNNCNLQDAEHKEHAHDHRGERGVAWVVDVGGGF